MSGHYKWYQSGTSAPMEQLFISTNELVHSTEGLHHSTIILVDSTKRLEAMVERYLVMLDIELPPPILVESPTLALREMTETPSSSTLLPCSVPVTQHAARDDVHLGLETGLRRMKGISQVPFPFSISLPCEMNFTCAIEFWGRQVKKWKYDCDYEFETCLTDLAIGRGEGSDGGVGGGAAVVEWRWRPMEGRTSAAVAATAATGAVG
ncbi:hypothetical protein LINPERHAP2_LOCUS19002 [Linum perenne]